MQKLIADLQKREMDRLDFLRFVGVALLLLTGISRIMKSLHTLSGSTQKGYGSSPYGQ